MNQLLGYDGYVQSRQDQPQSINVNVVVDLLQNTLKLSIDPDIPFNEFISGIKEQWQQQLWQALYEETIEYQLGNRPHLQQNESRPLKCLGFTNNCTLYVRLKCKPRRRKYKVLIDLQFKKMELQIEQDIQNPVSCIFHDILMELLNNQQIKIDRPLAFFINEKEIDPFNIQPIFHFINYQTHKAIIVNKILSNKQAKQDSIEKYEFAKNSIKQFKPFTRKTIKIEFNNNMQMVVENNTSLGEIFNNICSNFQIFQLIPYDSIKFYINDKELQKYKLDNIFAINNFKIVSEYYKETKIFAFEAIGDFNQRILIFSNIDQQHSYHYEYKSMNTSMDEFLKYFKFKIFGPKQINYVEHIVRYQDDYVEIHYNSKIQ